MSSAYRTYNMYDCFDGIETTVANVDLHCSRKKETKNKTKNTVYMCYLHSLSIT